MSYSPSQGGYQKYFKDMQVFWGKQCSLLPMRNRYQKYGVHGLRDRSCRSLNSPRPTQAEIIAKIVYLRERDHFGSWKIHMYLERYHDIMVSTTGGYRILKRLRMNRLPHHQRQRRYKERFRRYEKPLPGHRMSGSGKKLGFVCKRSISVLQFSSPF